MDDSSDTSSSAQIECAKIFDRKLEELRKKVCEPSLLGGGTKSREAVASIKNEAESLLERVVKLTEDVTSNNEAIENSLSDYQSWMDEVLSQLEPLEAKGREAGLLQTEGNDGENHDTLQSSTSWSSLSVEGSQSHHKGRNPSRRLF